MTALTTQATTPATVPSGTQIAADQVGAANAPASGDRLQYIKLDAGAAGASSPITGANPLPVYEAGRVLTNLGSVGTFRTPGRAGTAGQKVLALHNATGSSVVVRVTKVAVDLYQTVVKAVTVPPPAIRLYKVTVLPSNGTALTKVTRDSELSGTSASVTVWGDASADGTSSTTGLTATLGGVITQEFAPRLLTAAGYEMFDRTEFLNDGEQIVLHALEGVVLMLDYTLATQNPITDMWVGTIHWTESAT